MRDRERRGFKIMQQKGHDALLPGVSQRIGQAFAASFASFTPSSPCELTFPSLCALSSQREGTSSHTHTHLSSLWRNASFYLQKPNSRLHVSRSQVPILSSVCLLYSLHNAGINFSKPIWAAARFGKERRAELLCWGKFPLHTSLEVDRSRLYAACFNLHTEQRERRRGERTRRGEGSQHTAGNH